MRCHVPQARMAALEHPWISRPHKFRLFSRKHSGQRLARSIARYGAFSDWDTAAVEAVEGGLILSFGTSLYRSARSRWTGQILPQILPPQPGKLAAVSVVGALPTLQWMVGPSNKLRRSCSMLCRMQRACGVVAMFSSGSPDLILPGFSKKPMLLCRRHG